ncbi:MAG: polyprenol monophosphomannose synthase [Phycisphaerae bacterium]
MSAREPTHVSIVVPTFRESENLRLLCARIFAALDRAAIDGEVILVDDDSRDGTEAVAAELAQSRPVRLVVRTRERGLSSAVLRGFAEARHEWLLVMDADLSHPPEKIPDLLAPLLAGEADFVIGSRYVAGAAKRDWSWLRWVNSAVATLLARPLTPVRDPMAGFFALHRDSWRRADALNPLGYKIGLELLVKARCQRVREVPIEFADRLHGKSKLTVRQQLLYLLHLSRLYRHRYPWLRWGVPLLLVALVALLARVISRDAAR